MPTRRVARRAGVAGSRANALAWAIRSSSSRATQSSRPAARAAWLVLFVSLYGASDEFHQRFTPGRSCDVRDWGADTLAALLVALVALAAARVRAARPPPEIATFSAVYCDRIPRR